MIQQIVGTRTFGRARFAPILLAVGLLSLAVTAGPASASPSGAALNRSLPELKFDGVGLSDCIDFIRDVSGANINVNWKALAEANVQKDAPISVKLYSVPLRKALSLILNDASGGDALTYYVEDNVIEITTKAMADKVVYVRVYPIEDLLLEVPDFTDAPSMVLSSSGGGASSGNKSPFPQGTTGIDANKEVKRDKEQRAQDLVALIMATIQPDVWRENGGTASVKYFNGSLVVSAPRSVHEALGGAIE